LINEKLDRMESNFGEFKAAFSRLQAMIEERLSKPAEPNHQAQAGQNVDQASSSIRVQPSFGEQLPTTPPSTHRFPIGAEERNAMPMRPPNQDIRLQPNQTRVGVQMGEGMRNGQNRPILGDFGDPIEERRNVGNNARVMPPFQGHFDAPYEEPWLGMRQGRQQGQQGQQAQLEPILGDFGDPIEERRNVGNNARFMPPFQGHFDAPYEEPWLGRRQGRQQVQQGQQAQFEPHAAPPRHEMHFGDPREDQWGLNDQDEARFDPRRGRPARERPRQYQGAHHRDPCWQEQDGPPWNQGRARDPRPMKLDFPRFKGGDPTAWVYRALQYFHYYQVLEPEKVMHASYHLDEEALVWFQDCEHELHGWNDFVRAIQIRFGPASYDDPMELLTKLKQTHNIAAYKIQFESTSNRVRDLSDMHKLSCFMSGMKDEIRLAVKMQGPRNLGEAYALAKIQEEYLATVKRSARPTYEPSRGSWVQSQA
jgi:hypothetical protein